MQASTEQRVLDILGGPKAIGSPARNTAELGRAIRQGLSKASLLSVKRRAALTDRQLATMLGISEKTLGRIKEDEGRRLDAVSSDRLYRLARIFAIAEHALESAEAAHEWLHHPQVGLGNQVPLDSLQTEVGAREVENLLGRIEYGVYS